MMRLLLIVGIAACVSACMCDVQLCVDETKPCATAQDCNNELQSCVDGPQGFCSSNAQRCTSDSECTAPGHKCHCF